jgi:hypothetical protein
MPKPIIDKNTVFITLPGKCASCPTCVQTEMWFCAKLNKRGCLKSETASVVAETDEISNLKLILDLSKLVDYMDNIDIF